MRATLSFDITDESRKQVGNTEMLWSLKFAFLGNFSVAGFQLTLTRKVIFLDTKPVPKRFLCRQSVCIFIPSCDFPTAIVPRLAPFAPRSTC